MAQIKKVSFYISRRRKKIKWEKCFISFFGRLRFHLTEIFLSCCCCYWWCHIKMIMIVLSWNKTQNFLFDNFKFLSYNLRSHLPPPPPPPTSYLSLSLTLKQTLVLFSSLNIKIKVIPCHPANSFSTTYVVVILIFSKTKLTQKP